jgi:hypothetical protein
MSRYASLLVTLSQLACGLALSGGQVAAVQGPSGRADSAHSSALAPGETWAAVAKSRDVTAVPLPQLKAKVSSAIEQLEERLADLPNGESLRTALGTELLTTQLAGSPPSVERLESIYRRLRRRYPPPVQEDVDTLRTAVWRYTSQLRIDRTPQSQEVLEKHIDMLAGGLDKAAPQIDRQREVELREAFAFAASCVQIEDLLPSVRSSLSLPNQVIRVQNAYLEDATRRPISIPISVNERAGGAVIRGEGTMRGNIEVLLKPNQQRGELHVKFRGSGLTPLTIQRGSTNLRASGKTRLQATQVMYLTAAGIQTTPPQVSASNRTSLCSVQLGIRSRLLRRLATPLVRCIVTKQLAEKDPEAAAKARRELETRIQRDGFVIVYQINDLVNRLLWQTLDARDVDPRSQMRSTTEELQWTGEYAAPWQLAALRAAPPVIPAEPDVLIQFHESAFNNTSVAMAGKRMNEQVLLEILVDNLKLVPEAFEEEPSAIVPAAMTFADVQPLQVEIEAGQVTATFRIAGFEHQGRQFPGPREIRVCYLPKLTGSTLTVVRQGEIEVVPADDPNISQLNLALERFFPRRIRSAATVSPENLRGKLQIAQLTLDNGWFSVALERTAANGDED